MTMSDGQIRLLLQRYVEDPWNAGDLDGLDDVTTDDFEFEGGRNLEEFKEIIREFRGGFPDWTVTIGEVVAQDDKIAFRWTMHGTQQGEFDGIAPTGKSISASGMTFLRLKDGKVAEDHFESSSPGASEQLTTP